MPLMYKRRQIEWLSRPVLHMMFFVWYIIDVMRLLLK